MTSFSLLRPSTLARARAAVLEPSQSQSPAERVLRAGGIDLLDHIKEGLERPSALVELASIGGAVGQRLRASNHGPKGSTLGALLTLAQVAEHSWSRGHRALGAAAGSAANPGIRNIATLGGNLLQRPRCWYYRDREISCLKKGGDRCYALDGENRHHAVLGGGPVHIVHPSTLACALLALDAEITIAGTDGSEYRKAIADLYHLPDSDPTTEHTLVPGEVLLEVELPPSSSDQRSSYSVARERASYDWPLVEVAVRLRLQQGKMTGVRVALGHVAPVPWQALEAQSLLEGKAPSMELFEAAGRAAFSGAKPLRHNEYKIRLGSGLVRKALHEATDLPLPE